MKNGKKILLVMLITATIFGVFGMDTYSYFSNIEIAKSTMTAGTWMGIDTEKAILTGNGWTNLHGIFLIPGGPGSDDRISKIAISWTGGEGKVTGIRIGGKIFWSGIGVSGQELTAEDSYTLDKKSVNEYSFDSDMHGKTFTIDITMDDGQVISETFSPKWRDEKPEGHESSSDNGNNGNNDDNGDKGNTETVTGDHTETLTIGHE